MRKVINFILLKLAPVYRVFGVDIEQLKTLVITKFIVGNRTAKGSGTRKQKNMLVRQLVVSALITPLFFIILYFDSSLQSAIFIYFSMVMLLTIMNFMTEYPYLFFNKTENSILERLPVSDATMMAARLTAMIGYLGTIILGMALIPSCIIWIQEGIGAGLLFILATFFTGCFSLMIANLLYTLMIKLMPADKFEKLSGYFMIIVIVAISLSYQLINQVAKELNIDLFNNPPLWVWFTPPAWFTAIPMAFIDNGSSISKFILLAIGALLLLAMLNTRIVSNNFMQQTARIMQASGGNLIQRKSIMCQWLAARFTRNGMERAGFLLTWRLMSDNMKFKQSILPMLIYSVIFSLIILYRSLFSGKELDFTQINGLLRFIPILYVSGGLSLLIYSMIGVTDKENVMDIYAGRPIEKPGLLLLGAFKAAYLKYFIPLFVILCIPIFYVGKTAVILQIVMAFLLLTFAALAYFRYNAFAFPFSLYSPNGTKGNASAKIILNLLVFFLLFAIHIGFTFIPYSEILFIPIAIGAIFWISKNIRQADIQKIKV